MLLPNLEFNPEYEGKHANDLLSLEAQEAQQAEDSLLSLAQQANWLHSRSYWVPKSTRTYNRDWRYRDEEQSYFGYLQ